MARIAGVDIPKAKKIGTALTYIYGIGPTSAAKILEEARVSPDLRTSTLGEDQVARIRDVIDANYRVEGDLRKGNIDEHQASDGPRGIPGAFGTARGCRRGVSVPHERPDPEGSRARAPSQRRRKPRRNKDG